MNQLYRLIRESGLSLPTFILVSFLACASSLLAVLPPHFLGAAINAIVGAEISGPAAAFSPIAPLNGWLSRLAGASSLPPLTIFLTLFFLFNLAYLLLRNVFAVLVCYCSDRFIVFIRRECFARIIRGEKPDLARFESGDLVHRVMNDTQQLDYLIGNPLYTLCSDVLDLVWISAIVVMIDWKILPVLISVIPLLYLISRKTGRLQRSYALAIQHNEALGTGFIQRSALGLDTIKAYQGEQREITDFNRLSGRNLATRQESNINLSFFFLQEGVLRAAGTMAVIAYSAFLATEDPTYIGVIPVLLIYTAKFYAPLGNWARYYQSIQRGLVSYQRIQEILAIGEERLHPAPPAGPEQVLPIKIDGSISFEPGGEVPLNLEVAEPGLIIVKGKSGVGKTRLIKSLIGLDCEFRGELKLGRTPLEKPGDIRNHVALATQDGHFIPGTLGENLSYPSADIDEEKCRKILESLGLTYGPDHPVAEYGKNLSLGEQRRVIFGRALYSDKPVLILDEIDANVDGETRQRLYRLIRQVMIEKVIIMISHIHSPELDGGRNLAVTISRS